MGTLARLAIIVIIILLLSLEYFIFLSWKELKNKGSKIANKLYIIHLSPVIIVCVLYGVYIVHPSVAGFIIPVIIFLSPVLGYVIGFLYAIPALILARLSQMFELKELAQKRKLTGSSR